MVHIIKFLLFIILDSPAAVQKTPTKGNKGDSSLWSNSTPQQDATSALAHLGAASLAANAVSIVLPT